MLSSQLRSRFTEAQAVSRWDLLDLVPRSYPLANVLAQCFHWLRSWFFSVISEFRILL